MRVFIKMRNMLMDSLSLKLDIKEIKTKLSNQDKSIELVFSYLDELMEKQDILSRDRKLYLVNSLFCA